MRFLLSITTLLFVHTSFALESIVISDEDGDTFEVTGNSIGTVIKNRVFSNGFPVAVDVYDIDIDFISGTANTGSAAINFVGGDYGSQFFRRFWRIKFDVRSHGRIYKYSCKLMRDEHPKHFSRAIWAIKECDKNDGNPVRLFSISDQEIAESPTSSADDVELNY